MPSSDISRGLDGQRSKYRGVVAQQGRVTVDRDLNALQEIGRDELRARTLDVVGPAGTADDGFRVTPPFAQSPPLDPPAAPPAGPPADPAPYDFAIAPGTMYVGGERAVFDPPAGRRPRLTYLHQPDWLAPDPLADPPRQELAYLEVAEQEVGGVEDRDLLEVALGGPDTTARLRLVQRVKRLAVGNAVDCATALADAERQWARAGYALDRATMRLASTARLQASYADAGSPPNLCEPDARGGYLGAENQLVRVQVSVDARGAAWLLWGFDNASTLYEVAAVAADNRTLQLKQSPVDQFHVPLDGQAVEVLSAGVALPDGGHVAERQGFVTTLDGNYAAGTVRLADPVAGLDPARPAYLRVWEDRLPLTLGQAVPLGATGLSVTVTATGGAIGRDGDFWMIAVRPGTPQTVYPERLLAAPQPPDGPRRWVCPLAFIDWANRRFTDCRRRFCNLVAVGCEAGGGCCTVEVRPEDVADGTRTLQSILDTLPRRDLRQRATVCLAPGRYPLPAPLRLGRQHSNLTIEGHSGAAELSAAEGKEAAFVDGLVVMVRANGVTLRGLRFRLPQAPAADATGLANGLGGPFPAAGGRARLQNLRVGVGVRPVHCAVLAITDCVFRFPLTRDAPGFAVGVFAASQCWGLVVERNQFVRSEDYLRSRSGFFRATIGYAIAPSFGTSGSPTSVAGPTATAEVPFLEDARFRDNAFHGLSAATLILGDCGVVRFEKNTVYDCTSGLLAMTTVALLASLQRAQATGSTTGSPQPTGPLGALFPLFLADEALLLLLVYPLPKSPALHPPRVAVRLARVALESPPRPTEPAVPPRSVGTLLRRAREALVPAVVPATAAGRAATERAATERTGTEGGATEAAAAERAGAAEPTTTANATSCPAATAPGTVPAAAAAIPPSARAALLAAARAAPAAVSLADALRMKQNIHMSLQVTGNDIDTRIFPESTRRGRAPAGPSGSAVVVLDIEAKVAGTVTVTNNHLRSDSQTPTALLVVGSGGACAVTGNTILNDRPVAEGRQSGAWSLAVVAADRGTDQVAVAGNALRGVPVLPTRPAYVPEALRDWQWLNAENRS